MPKRRRGEYNEASADPQGLRELFQKHIPEFNNAMFIVALVINFNPTLTILYYEHVLKVLHSIKPSDEVQTQSPPTWSGVNICTLLLKMEVLNRRN